MKKFGIFVLVCIVCFLSFQNTFFIKNNISKTHLCVYAESVGDEDENFNDVLNGQLEKLNFDDFEEFVATLTDEELALFSSSGFLDKIKSILSGDYANGQKNFFSAVCNLFFNEILSILPLLSIVIAVCITFSLVSSARGQSKNSSITNIIHFICFGTIIILLLTCVTTLIDITTGTISSIKNQMEISFPILLTILTGIGGVTSVSVYQPAVVIIANVLTKIFTFVLMPLFVFRLCFSVVSNISSNIKLEKFASFCSSAFKWIIGAVFTIFSAFITIQGISASKIDSISYNTAKYAIKNSVPIIGGYISDSFNLIIASASMIKNAVGVAGMLLLLSTIILPILQLVIFMFALKFCAAILEPIADSRISNFISMLSKSISLLIVLILCCSFMYVLLLGLIMGAANYF